MRNTTRMRWSLPVAAVALTVWAGWAQQPGRTDKRVDNNALKNAAKNGDEWVTYGRDYAETHYSPLRRLRNRRAPRINRKQPAASCWRGIQSSARSAGASRTPAGSVAAARLSRLATWSSTELLRTTRTQARSFGKQSWAAFR